MSVKSVSVSPTCLTVAHNFPCMCWSSLVLTQKVSVAASWVQTFSTHRTVPFVFFSTVAAKSCVTPTRLMLSTSTI